MDNSFENAKKDASSPAFSTKIINTPFAKPDVHGAINLPIYRNAAFEFADSKAIEEAFVFRRDQHTYSRISNPTVTNLEDKIRSASGAETVMTMASGMAAISNTFMTIAYAGCNIVSSPHLFGNTFSLLNTTLSQFGVEPRFVDTNNLTEIASAIDENTCAFFAELITNPHLEVANLPEIAKILRKKNVPMIIDTTVIPWCGLDFHKTGIDIEIVSTTKYISGGATSIGGAILDYGTFDWGRNKKLNGLPPVKGMSKFALKLRSEIGRNLGACMNPDTAYMQSLGMETLQLRYERMSQTAYDLAVYLSAHPKIRKVNYPKLPTSPYKAISDELFIGNPGAMFTINLQSKQDCYSFMNALQVIRRATNLFDNKTLAIHPESTIYGTFSAEMKKVMGIEDDLIRFSVGLEAREDLIRDIETGLNAF
ncbi:MAG: PLP-dependent transferase [Dysgonamonadaceae bacterium]|jgi:O-acetylhomoserine (thiol)-lyase|nr:PLP-dependent transferase [Dysgonamonadaceae bacterium]